MQRDLILVGGGLANTLIAYRLRLEHPGLNLLLLEREQTLGGNHTWCFHDMDLTPEQHRWIQPFVAHSWDRYRIMFPKRDRWLESGYHAITSDQLHAVAAERLGDCVITGVDVESVLAEEVTLTDGRVFRGRAVIDGRGDPGGRHLDVRFQKFLGQVLELDKPHGLDGPILMDATVPQEDGFRFIYTLPLDERTVLVEDTRYSDTAGLQRDRMRDAIAAYAKARGWRIAAMTREEEGALPVVLGGSLRAYWKSGPGIPRSGIRAALFHFTTGYSFPEAVRLADDLAGLTPGWTSKALYNRIRRRSFSVWRRGLYFRLLNRMLYNGCEPSNRYRILQHFYRLPKDLVGRFYAGRPTWHDRFRILTGTPPIPISRALISLAGGDRHTLAGLTGGKS